MNTELLADLRRRVAASEPFTEALAALRSGIVEISASSLEARALLVAALAEKLGSKILVVVPGESALDDFEQALALFHAGPGAVASYPVPSLSPYQEVAPSLAVIRGEIRTIGLLVRGAVDILTVPAKALFRLLPPPQSITASFIELQQGADLDLPRTLQTLLENGFVRTDLVGEVGELAFRGGILDIFPPGSDRPIRIELFGDTVDSIRLFDPETQRSAEPVPAFTIEPATQFPITPAVRTALARQLSIDFNDPIYRRDLAEKIERLTEHSSFPGVESYLPAAVPIVPLLDFLAVGGQRWIIAVVDPDDALATIDRYETLLRTEWESSIAKGRAAYAPDRILVPAPAIRATIDQAAIVLTSLQLADRGRRQIRLSTPAAERFINRLGELPARLAAKREEGRTQILFVASKGGREKVERLFDEFSVPFVDEGDTLGTEIAVSNGTLARGFDLDAIRLSVLSEWDLFEPPSSTRVGRRKPRETFLTDLRDLRTGDYIVHVDHGIGRFRGLQRIAFGAGEREVMELEYSGGGKLLLPMESLHLIQKYSGGEDAHPRLDRLGGTSWARAKASVRKAMRDMADELLKLYATRQMVSGHPFSKDSPWQFDFEESFEFEETDDQSAAIDDVKNDMESRRPMDRLLCGDVGYGKTEVAMRAAFKAVMDGKQVAVLAPTTILAYQHYRTLLRRFASFPVTIELLTRYYSAKEQKQIVRKLESGEIDIVIGTHRILSKDIAFKDLGLLVIDEEQRFGVAQKERLKQLRKAVDVLAMSATPIPRTLHMSLVGIRDISVIETPPKDRLAIQTAVVPFDDDFIAEAIEFEVARGGQVFFVHNRVDSIHSMKEHLEKLVPGLRVIVGHGQMDERELERAMMAFIAKEYDVLLATTIIENGIDIPACNTILIDHSERFGLSQLYQLRGRVGRSDRLAFCYLLVPADRLLSSDARKRLAAIQEFSDLGAGFRIAARDLEIRGSGNILGGEQSGQIAAVGFEMYCKLLEEAVSEMKGEPVEEIVETSINIAVDIYIPSHYIEDENLRIMFYKRIASARDDGRLAEIRDEMRDRFGALPEGVENLLGLMRLKLLAQAIGVTSIVREMDTIAVKFRQGARIDPSLLVQLLAANSAAKFAPSGALSLPLSQRGGALIESLSELLSSLTLAA
ncbi:MAG TPA: transcription-repair coupling factor [Thermoanaerobaculia bacterium]|nr:transcription-repair coupling factor [Thermoanaerobaculia bacterium]